LTLLEPQAYDVLDPIWMRKPMIRHLPRFLISISWTDFRAGLTQSATSTEPPDPQQRSSIL